MAEVLRVVARLLERAEHERREAPRGRGRTARRTRSRAREIAPASAAACAGDSVSGAGGVGTLEVGELREQQRDRLRVGPLVDAVERLAAPRGEQAARPPRSRRSSAPRRARATRGSRLAPGALDAAASRRTRTGSRRSRSAARRGRSGGARSSPASAPAEAQRLDDPRLGLAAPAPGRRSGARRCGSPSGRTRGSPVGRRELDRHASAGRRAGAASRGRPRARAAASARPSPGT